MTTREELQSELAGPGEDYELDVEKLEAIVQLETVRVECGIGEREVLAGLVRLLNEMRLEDG